MSKYLLSEYSDQERINVHREKKPNYMIMIKTSFGVL